MNSDIPRVALLVETSLSVGRDVWKGVSYYMKKNHLWAVYAYPHGLGEPPPQWFEDWEGDGIIARFQNSLMMDAVSSKNVPVVDVLGTCHPPGAALVHVDDDAITDLVFDHLLEKGFQDFAFFGLSGESWSTSRRNRFRDRVSASGRGYDELLLSRNEMLKTEWGTLIGQVSAWIRTLPRPVGLHLCSDVEGLLVQEACRVAGRKVGEDVGLIGVNNDETMCEISYSPLSSVDVDMESVGYQAAALLDEMMAGKPAPAEPVLIPPIGVVARKSSDFLAVQDQGLSKALAYISNHCAESLSLDDIAQQAGLSRSALQRKFRSHLHKTAFDEVTSARIKKALGLLQTDLSVEEIAEKSGFGYAQTMGRIFQKHLGKSPKNFRRWDRK